MTDFGEALRSEDFRIKIAQDMNIAMHLCHGLAKEAGWWTNLETGEPLERNKGEMLCLMHSEISEAMEGARKNLMDDHLTHRSMEEVELADCIIRILDYCEGHKMDIGGALIEKLVYNTQRADHKIANRLTETGKKF